MTHEHKPHEAISIQALVITCRPIATQGRKAGARTCLAAALGSLAPHNDFPNAHGRHCGADPGADHPRLPRQGDVPAAEHAGGQGELGAEVREAGVTRVVGQGELRRTMEGRGCEGT